MISRSLLCLLLLGLLLVGVSSQSLWIDEGDTAYYAAQPTAGAWWRHLKSDPNADCQFPLSMALTWAWSRVFGTSEYAMRSINVVFSLIAVGAFALTGRLLGLRWLWVAPLLQPFFWFYLNEARPYSLQIAAGSLVMAGFVAIASGRTRLPAWSFLLFGSIVLFYSTLLSFVTLAAYLLAIGILLARGQARLPPRWPLLVLIGAIFVIPGCLYYLETVQRGAGGARIWAITPLNFAWVGYELTGAVGLGPGIAEIREIARAILSGQASLQTATLFVAPAILCALVALTFLVACPRLQKEGSLISISAFLAGVLIFVVFSFGALSIVLHKAFWARHLAPIFPIYACLFFVCLSVLWRSAAGSLPWRRGLAIACLIGLAASILIQRFGGHHQKDDYRQAAGLARAALERGDTVWWAGSWHCAAYYGLPAADQASLTPRFVLLSSPTPEALSSLPKASVVLLSRPDVYDGGGTIRQLTREARWQTGPQQPHLFSAWQTK